MLGDLADVADDVGGEAVAGVEPALLFEGFELGQLVAMGFDEGLLVGGDVLLERDGLEPGCESEVAKGRFDLLDRHVEPFGDHGQVGGKVPDLVAQEIAGS